VFISCLLYTPSVKLYIPLSFSLICVVNSSSICKMFVISCLLFIKYEFINTFNIYSIKLSSVYLRVIGDDRR